MRIPFSRWWTRPGGGSVARAAALIALASFCSRVLGVFRDRILASEFGAGDTLDVYYAAFRVPDFIYNLLVIGALSAGFIPVFLTARREGGGGRQWDLANSFLSFTAVTLAGLSGFFLLTAHRFIPWVTPGFDAEKTAAVVQLSRIMLLSPLLLGLSAVVGGVLQSYRQFFAYSLAPIFYNVGIISGALFLVPAIGAPGLAWGVVFGATLHLVVQLPAARSLGWPLRFSWNLRHRGVREILRLMVPRTLSLGVTQLNLLVLTILASYLVAGSVAILNLATNLSMVPVALIGIAYAIAAFPTLSDAVAAGDHEGFRAAFSETVRQVLLFIVPATVIYLLLRAQITRVVLGSGAFDWADTVLTLETLRWLAYGLFAQALVPLLVRAYYAHRSTFLPLLIGVVGDGVTLFGSIVAMRVYGLGVTALAAALSGGAITQAALLWVGLRWRVGDLGERAILRSLWQFTVAGVAMAYVTQGVKTGLGQFFGTTTFLDLLVQGGVAGLFGVVTYVALLILLRSADIYAVVAALGRRRPVVEVGREGLDESEAV